MQKRSPSSISTFSHVPVLSDEIVKTIANLPADLLSGGLLIDVTLGGGGHSALLLEAFPGLHLIGLDHDATARAAAAERLKPFGERVEILAGNFADFCPPENASVVLADLGVSSPQLDNASRGFSFRLNGPLDMRMNLESSFTAADLLEQSSESELAEIIFTYGEERRSRKIARRIKQDLDQHGPYEGTVQLAYAIAGCFPPKMRYGRMHPATRTFQALRIAVNDELAALKRFLVQLPNWLKEEAFACIISFHSLEDRCVKQAFIKDELLSPITRKPLVASDGELMHNPRSRSAKCRIAKRISKP